MPSGAGGVLDHSGKYIYLQLDSSDSCDAYQTYTIGKNGALTFNNWTEIAGSESPTNVPTILGNEAFAYAVDYDGHYSNTVGFARESSGAFRAINIQEIDPADPDGANAYPTLVAADRRRQMGYIESSVRHLDEDQPTFRLHGDRDVRY